MKVSLDIFNVLMFTSSLISFIVTLLYSENFANGYQGMLLLPILFLIVYFFILQNLRRRNRPFTIYGIIMMEWIRFVLMPPICAMAGENVGFAYILPTTGSLWLSIFLIIYELICISIFSTLWFNADNKSYANKLKDKILFLEGNKIVYFVFIIVAIVVALTVGNDYNLLNFIYITIESSERVGDVTDTYIVLARQIIILGLFLIFLLTVNHCRVRYKKTNKRVYINIAILVALLNVTFIVGERRTAQIYTTIICMWILLKTFPLHKKRIIVSIGTIAIFVLSLMSIYKFFAAFNQGSYIAALSTSSADIPWFSRTLQSYFFGPENIAAVIDFSSSYDIRIQNVIYDLFRSVFGISFLMKGEGTLTSELFNTYIYGTATPTGHVISAIGYGYIFFGLLLSPIMTILNIVVSSVIERQMYMSKNYELAYIWGYVLVRFATNLFVNPAPLISYSTMILGTGGFLFFIAIILKRTRLV